jgi:Tfp pilus assembly protein PilF
MHTLAIIYDDQGRTAEARELFTRCLKGLERLHYPGHPDLLLALHNFGAFCSGQGEIDRAEELFLQSLDAWVKCHPEHPRVLAAFHNLAVIAWSKGRLDQAEEYFFKVAHGRESVLGIEHPLTTDSFHALEAVIAENKGQAEPKKLFILSKL